MKRIFTDENISRYAIPVYDSWYRIIRIWKYGYIAGTQQYEGMFCVIIAKDNLFEGL